MDFEELIVIILVLCLGFFFFIIEFLFGLIV